MEIIVTKKPAKSAKVAKASSTKTVKATSRASTKTKTPKVAPAPKQRKEPTYFGSMLALRTAAKQYQKGLNGQPHCGDSLAAICAQHKPVTVIRACIDVLGLGSNPYIHLNIGQQSMNLRNKVRAALAKGGTTIELVEQALIRAA